MRTLSLSLIIVTLIATIGLSWVFDTLYLSFQQDKAISASDRVAALESVTLNLAQSLSTVEDKQIFVDQWQQDYGLQILQLDELSLPRELANTLSSGLPLTLESEDRVSIHALVSGTEQLLLLEFDHTPATNNRDGHRYWITSLFYALLIGVFLVWLTPLLQRLLKLRKVAKAFGDGQLDRRIEVGSISYIRDVETEFNHMAQRIEDLVADVKLLSSAVSHDLRTPLAKLRMGLDTLNEESDPELRAQYHQRLDGHLDNMVELVETLLQYARMDQAMIHLEKRSVNLTQLITSCLGQYSEQIQFETSLKDDQSIVLGDARYLKIALNNLLQNAIKYGRMHVRVCLYHNEEHLLVSIDDDGDGIPTEQHEQIFKPFVRAKNTEKQGFGVGLAIVKRVLDWHQANISVGQSTSLNGASFTISIKKAR